MEFDGSGPYGYHGEPFGDVGAEIRSYVRDMQSAMAEDVSESDPAAWRADDHEMLMRVVEIEDLAPLMTTEPELRGDKDRELSEALHDFRTALPFTEAERGWLLRLSYKTQAYPYPRDFAPFVAAQEDTILSAGCRTVVNGHDLMRRWLAWRRQADEFQGQGSMAAAREALTRLAAILLPRVAPLGSDEIS